MLGLGGGFDPKKMQSMMKQLGMSQQDIDASKVTIEKADGSKIIVENPSVAKISFQGNESFQVSGDIREESAERFSEKDVETVMGKTGASKSDAVKALEDANGDLAEAIMGLS